MALLLLDSKKESLKKFIVFINEKMKANGFNSKERETACVLIEQNYFDILKYSESQRAVAKCCMEGSKYLSVRFFNNTNNFKFMVSGNKLSYEFPNNKIIFVITFKPRPL